MKKLALILGLVAFMGLAFIPSIKSLNDTETTYSDTTKAVKKTKSKTKSKCTTNCCKESSAKSDKNCKSSCTQTKKD